MKNKTLIFIVIVMVMMGMLHGAYAQDQRFVRAIEVNGNKAISSATILAKIKSKPGDVFSQEVINEDIKRLYALGFFTDVAVSFEDFEDGVKVIIRVQEKPVIKEIKFSGSKRLRSERLRKMMKSMPGELLDRAQLNADMKEIKQFYQQRGFFGADATYKVYVDESNNQAEVLVQVTEDKQVKVARISFSGNKTFPASDLLKYMKTRKAWIFSSGMYNKEDFSDDLERVKLYYRSQGFLDAEVDSAVDYAKNGRLLYLTVKVDEGRRYFVNNIEVVGTKVFPEPDLKKILVLQPGKPFSEDGLHEDALKI